LCVALYPQVKLATSTQEGMNFPFTNQGLFVVLVILVLKPYRIEYFRVFSSESRDYVRKNCLMEDNLIFAALLLPYRYRELYVIALSLS